MAQDKGGILPYLDAQRYAEPLDGTELAKPRRFIVTLGQKKPVHLESKTALRILFVGALITLAAVAYHAALRADALYRVMVPVAALFLGGIAAGFPWLAYALNAEKNGKSAPRNLLFAMRLFVCVGAIGWIGTVTSMFTLDHDGGEAAVSSVTSVCLAISAAKILRKLKEPNQPPQPIRASGPLG
jgi:hypothetical protein